jgi:hypothetical protein
MEAFWGALLSPSKVYGALEDPRADNHFIKVLSFT